MQREAMIAVDVSGLPASATVVDTLARVALGTRRAGHQLRLCHASRELLELIDLAGLSHAFGTAGLTPDRPPRTAG